MFMLLVAFSVVLIGISLDSMTETHSSDGYSDDPRPGFPWGTAKNPVNTGMSFVIPAGSHIWGQVDDYVTQKSESLCMTPEEHEGEVLSLVRRLENQEGRSLDLVFPGDRFILQDSSWALGEYFCTPPKVLKDPSEAPIMSFNPGNASEDIGPAQSNMPPRPPEHYKPPQHPARDYQPENPQGF